MLDQTISLCSQQNQSRNHPSQIIPPPPPLLANKSSRQSSNTRSTNLLAYTYATISSISIVISQINLKKLTHYFQPTLILGIRGTLLFAFNLLYFIYSNKKFHMQDPKVFRAIMKRATFSTLTLIMYLGSIKYLPIGIVNSLFNTMPIMTFFLDYLYYKKRVFSWFNLLMILISFIGVLCIIQPPFLFGGTAPQHFIMYFVVLTSALTGTFSVLFLHDLRGKVEQVVILMHGYLVQGLSNYILYILIHHDDTKSIEYLHNLSIKQIFISIAQLLIMVLFAFLTQFCMARSTFLCSPALVMPFSYVSVIAGFIIDILLFDAQYGWVMILGMCMASVGLFSKFIALYFTTHGQQKQKKNIQIKQKQITK